MRSGSFAEALAEAEEAYRLAPWNSRVCGIVAGLLRLMGRVDEAVGYLAKMENMAPFGKVTYHLLARETDAAADWYEKSIEQREPLAVLAARAPVLRALHESPRWPKLAAMMNLPERVS